MTLILLFISIFMLYIFRSKDTVRLYLFSFVSGAVAEIFAIKYGAWSYTNSSIMGIPTWLPFLCGIASLFILKNYFIFNKYLNKKNT